MIVKNVEAFVKALDESEKMNKIKENDEVKSYMSFTKEELADVLKLPNFYKDNYYETKRIILERAVKEVNFLEEGVKIISFSRLAEGRKYVGVSFVVKKG